MDKASRKAPGGSRDGEDACTVRPVRQETHDTIGVLLDDMAHQGELEIDDVVDAILNQLAALGDELLEHLDPPQGLGRWLQSHGLSLVATREVAPPKIWELIEEEESVSQEVHPALDPELKVGDHVSYQTAPEGPRGQSQLGAGKITAIRDMGEDWGLVVTVRISSTELIHLIPGQGDVIKPHGPGS